MKRVRVLAQILSMCFIATSASAGVTRWCCGEGQQVCCPVDDQTTLCCTLESSDQQTQDELSSLAPAVRVTTFRSAVTPAWSYTQVLASAGAQSRWLASPGGSQHAPPEAIYLRDCTLRL